MDWAALLIHIQSWGPPAISGLLIVAVLSLIRKLEQNSTKAEKDTRELRNDINSTLNNFGARLSTIEKDYTKNETFFRELSGWRTEINRLSDNVTSNFVTLTQHVIEILSKGKR